MLGKASVKTIFAVITIISVLLCTSCGSKEEPSASVVQTPETTEAPGDNRSERTEAEKEPPVSEPAIPNEPKAEEPPETEQRQETAPPETEQRQETAPPASEESSDVIQKILCAADDTGIYATVITLSDQAADQGVIEMVYDGAAGTPQENSVICTFRIEYEKESSGTFEIKTFYNGEVYQNYHHKENVKVDNTFGAGVRAGNIVVSYTPVGGEPQEVYRASADQFR